MEPALVSRGGQQAGELALLSCSMWAASLYCSPGDSSARVLQPPCPAQPLQPQCVACRQPGLDPALLHLGLSCVGRAEPAMGAVGGRGTALSGLLWVLAQRLLLSADPLVPSQPWRLPVVRSEFPAACTQLRELSLSRSPARLGRGHVPAAPRPRAALGRANSRSDGAVGGSDGGQPHGAAQRWALQAVGQWMEDVKLGELQRSPQQPSCCRQWSGLLGSEGFCWLLQSRSLTEPHSLAALTSQVWWGQAPAPGSGYPVSPVPAPCTWGKPALSGRSQGMLEGCWGGEKQPLSPAGRTLADLVEALSASGAGGAGGTAGAAHAENKQIPGQGLGPGQRGLEGGERVLQDRAAAVLLLVELLCP